MYNLVVIGLDYRKIKCLAEKLSNLLGMYFLDIYDYIEYDISNKGEMINNCGLEYYLAQEKKLVTSCFSFENMVLNIRYNQFYEYVKNNKNLAHNMVLYIRTDEKNISKRIIKQQQLNSELIGNIITFEYRDNFLKNNSDIIISYDTYNEKKIIKDVLNKLKEVGVYENESIGN